MFPLPQPFFQEMSAWWLIIADSMPRRAPLKKKIAAAFTVFIEYYCCSPEEQEDPLPKEKQIRHHLMVATAIHFYFKSMPPFGQDPERIKRERKREKSLARGKEEPELSPAVPLRENAVHKEELALQQWLSILLRQKGRRAAASALPWKLRKRHCSHADPLPQRAALLPLNLPATAPSTAIAFPEHPWAHSPGPGSLERLSKAAPCPSAHCTPRTTTLSPSCRSAGAPTLPCSPTTRWEQQSSSFLSSPAHHPILTLLQSFNNSHRAENGGKRATSHCVSRPTQP